MMWGKSHLCTYLDVGEGVDEVVGELQLGEATQGTHVYLLDTVIA